MRLQFQLLQKKKCTNPIISKSIEDWSTDNVGVKNNVPLILLHAKIKLFKKRQIVDEEAKGEISQQIEEKVSLIVRIKLSTWWL